MPLQPIITCIAFGLGLLIALPSGNLLWYKIIYVPILYYLCVCIVFLCFVLYFVQIFAKTTQRNIFFPLFSRYKIIVIYTYLLLFCWTKNKQKHWICCFVNRITIIINIECYFVSCVCIICFVIWITVLLMLLVTDGIELCCIFYLKDGTKSLCIIFCTI